MEDLSKINYIIELSAKLQNMLQQITQIHCKIRKKLKDSILKLSEDILQFITNQLN